MNIIKIFKTLGIASVVVIMMGCESEKEKMAKHEAFLASQMADRTTYANSLDKTLQNKRKGYILSMVTTGLISKITPEATNGRINVTVTKGAWNNLDFDEKGKIARTILDYHMIVNNGVFEKVDIDDRTNLNRLAMYTYIDGLYLTE